jgi:hypothetical protein
MIHNGIEYGLMQAYAEGFSILQHKTEFKLDLHQIAEIWRYGSVVRSWLLDLTANALEKNPTLHGIAPLCRRFGRGALDGRRGHRTRRAGGRDHGLAARAAAIARCRFVFRQAARGDAQSIRRPRDQDRIARSAPAPLSAFAHLVAAHGLAVVAS